MTDHLTDIADDIRDLTQPYKHEQPYDRIVGGQVKPAKHVTRHPSLIDQLRAAETAGRGSDGQVSGYESRPAARLEAIATLTQIDTEAATWITWRRHKLRPTTEDNLRAVVGIATDLGPDDRSELAGEVRRWLTWARVVTGWDSPPWRPNVPCPMCAVKGGLRIRLLEESAACLDCGSVWDKGTIGLLAEEIRLATEGRGALDRPA